MSSKAPALSVVLLAVACSPKVSDGPAAGPPKAEVPAELSARPVPPRETPDRAAPEEAKALPPICPGDGSLCESYVPVIQALDGGEYERAREILAEIPVPEAGRERELHLLLRGRALLESDSLAYGEGGQASEEALVLFQAMGNFEFLADHVRLHVARAQLSLGQGDRAVADLRALADRFRGDAEVQAALGIAYLSTGRAARALAPLRRATELDPKQPERFIVLGTTHMLLGDLAQAERCFRSAVSLDATSARAHGDLGAVLLVQGKVPEGRAHLLRASRIAPERATYAANLSYADLLGKKPKEAEKWAQKALELDPELAAAWLNLGLAQVALGRRDEARESFEKAKQLDPSDPRPDNNLRDLDELESIRRGDNQSSSGP